MQQLRAFMEARHERCRRFLGSLLRSWSRRNVWAEQRSPHGRRSSGTEDGSLFSAPIEKLEWTFASGPWSAIREEKRALPRVVHVQRFGAISRAKCISHLSAREEAGHGDSGVANGIASLKQTGCRLVRKKAERRERIVHKQCRDEPIRSCGNCSAAAGSMARESCLMILHARRSSSW